MDNTITPITRTELYLEEILKSIKELENKIEELKNEISK